MSTTRRQLLGSVYRRHRVLLGSIVVFQLASGMVRAAGSALVEPLTNAILDRVVDVFVLVLVASLLLNTAAYVTRWAAAVLTTHLQGHALLQLRLDTVRHIMRMPMLDFEARGRGEYVSLVQRDAQQAAERVYTVWSRIFTCVSTGVFSILAMALLDLGLTAILVAATLVAGFLNSAMLRRVKAAEQDARRAQGSLTDTVLGAVAAFDVVRIFGAVGFVRTIFASGRDRLDDALLRSTHIDGQRVGLYTIVSTGTVFTAALWMAYRVTQGEANVGALAAYIALMLQGLVSIETAFRWWSRLAVADASWDRLDELAAPSARIPAVHGGSEAGQLPESQLPDALSPGGLLQEDRRSLGGAGGRGVGVQVTSLDVLGTFTYPDAERPIRHHVAAELGAITRIPGDSGSGKTTFLKCLLGLYPLDSGATIAIDGRPATQDALARRCSYAPAQGGLFEGTIEENLTLGDPDITTERILSGAAALGIDDWLVARGLDSDVGPAGSRLSGGQRQMLGVLRAVLAPRDVLILDEPFSALDATRSACLARGLHDIAETKLTIITSHHPTTVGDATTG